MSTRSIRALIVASFGCLALLGCAAKSTDSVLGTTSSQVQARSIQTRAFDTTDKTKMMRNVISTLQDLDFVIERADNQLGSVTGTKFAYNSPVKMTVTVRPRGEKQLLVRANARYGLQAVSDPQDYQDFFVALEKALFLTAHQVN